MGIIGIINNAFDLFTNYCLKIIVARKKGNKDYTQREKQMMISLINDCFLFGATYDEMIKMLSVKLGKENNEKIPKLFSISKKRRYEKKENHNNGLIIMPDTNLLES